jgi:hypothetical protein
MDWTFIPAYLMAAILALILIAPLLPGEMPDYPDQREKPPVRRRPRP